MFLMLELNRSINNTGQTEQFSLRNHAPNSYRFAWSVCLNYNSSEMQPLRVDRPTHFTCWNSYYFELILKLTITLIVFFRNNVICMHHILEMPPPKTGKPLSYEETPNFEYAPKQTISLIVCFFVTMEPLLSSITRSSNH